MLRALPAGGAIVAIADVSFYVRPGTLLDREARSRGNSVYFPDRVVPMLPEGLSNNLCSLVGGRPRLAYSVHMVFDEKGARHAYNRMFVAYLRTFARLEREQFRSEMGSAAIARLKLGWLTLDAQGGIVETSPNIEEMFQWGTLLRRGRYDRLVPAAPAADRQLTEWLKQLSAGAEPRPLALNLARDPLLDLLATPLPGDALAGQGRAVAIVYVSGDRRSAPDPPRRGPRPRRGVRIGLHDSVVQPLLRRRPVSSCLRPRRTRRDELRDGRPRSRHRARGPLQRGARRRHRAGVPAREPRRLRGPGAGRAWASLRC